MAYTPINWQTGDTITAEKMNKMDNGWGVESTQLFSETVTTVTSQGQPAPFGQLTYHAQITASSLTVVFNGETFNLPLTALGEGNLYGEMGQSGPSFATYPLCIFSTATDGNILYTEATGTYAISASVPSVAIGSIFKDAVTTATGGLSPMLCVSGVTTAEEVRLSYFTDKRLLYFKAPSTNAFYFISQIQFTTNIDAIVTFYPGTQLVSASVTNGVFTVTES